MAAAFVARACGETALIWHWRRGASLRARHALMMQMRLTSAGPRCAARPPAFTCAEACASSAAAASPPLELDGGAPPWCEAVDGDDDAGRALAVAQPPPPLMAPEVDALRAVWLSIDAAFKARARAPESGA